MPNRVHHPETPYIGCTRCGLHKSRRRIVFRGEGRVDRGTVEREGKLLYYRGELDTGLEEGVIGSPIFNDIILLFIGEAPGATEDITGLPFQGKAGRIFHFCLSLCKTTFDFEVTNLVACRPTKESNRGNIINRAPSPEEIKKCRPRVKELTKVVHYDGFVHLGDIASKLPLTNSIKLQHPSAILRQEYKYHDAKQFAFHLDSYVKDIRNSRLED